MPRKWVRALGNAPTMASKPLSREVPTERLEAVELAAIARDAEPVIKSRALSETVKMKPVDAKPRMARGSTPQPPVPPVAHPRGPRRKREKLKSLKF